MNNKETRMRHSRVLMAASAAATVGLLVACAYSGAGEGGNPMSFFITSANPGKGADLGGLAGADRHCQALAAAVGAGGRTWHAYLSTAATASSPAVNARDRIGRGPWRNVKGVVVAANVDELHGANKLNKQNSLTEKGGIIPGKGEPGIAHDILTGSTPDGRAPAPGRDATCSNWTSSTEGGAIVGHHDRDGINPDPVANVSWNSSHPTPGCSPGALKRVGGAGLLYCFAAN
ncbi:MAG TPA: hypothetical protein VGA59_04325 [Ramlibacter sp.]|jgi:hypothetical protein